MWIIQQEDMLLPVVYYHVVFTLPHELNLLCIYDPRVLYDLLFDSAWHTINTLAKDPQWIGASTAATLPAHPLRGSFILMSVRTSTLHNKDQSVLHLVTESVDASSSPLYRA